MFFNKKKKKKKKKKLGTITLYRHILEHTKLNIFKYADKI